MNEIHDDMLDFFSAFDDKTIIEILFAHHPRKERNEALYEQIECCFRSCAEKIFALIPNRFERIKAITALQDAMFWSIAAIDRSHAIANYVQKCRMRRELAEIYRKKAMECLQANERSAENDTDAE
jgi:hypothetical protein